MILTWPQLILGTALIIVVTSLVVGSFAYNIGVEHGFSQLRKKLQAQIAKLKTADIRELQEFRQLAADIQSTPPTTEFFKVARPALQTITALLAAIDLEEKS